MAPTELDSRGQSRGKAIQVVRRRRTLFACYPQRWAVVAVEVSLRGEGARDLARDRAEQDITADFRGALAPAPTKNHAAVADPSPLERC